MKVSIIEINFKEISVQPFRNSDMLLLDITVRTEQADSGFSREVGIKQSGVAA